MPRQDTVDFLTAFAVGTVLGIGATLLLQPERTPRERIARQLGPYRKQMRKSYRQFARGVRKGSGATSELTSEAIGAGRELLGEFRAEVADILDQARSDLKDLVADQVKEIGRTARRTRRHAGM
jgi:gas vesicle protein